MKKNKMMRLASVMLIAALATTSAVSGTFAKYVTSDSATDTARVAKFGAVVSVSGELFGPSYAAGTDGGANSIQAWEVHKATVSAVANGTNVVAPGTKNDTGMTISVTGTPEVSTKLELDDVKSDEEVYTNTDIYLAGSQEYGVMAEYKGTVTGDNVTKYYVLNSGTYSKATAVGTAGTKYYELHDEAKPTAKYYPITWSLDDTPLTEDNNTVAGLKTAVSTAFTNTTANPNENLATKYGSHTVKWEWKFEDGDNEDAIKGIKVNDRYDTILGDMIAAALKDTTFTDNGTVVYKDGTNYLPVNYTETPIAATTTSGEQNKVYLAYKGNTAPTNWTDTTVLACLTVNFGAQVSVTQVD